MDWSHINGESLNRYVGAPEMYMVSPLDIVESYDSMRVFGFMASIGGLDSIQLTASIILSML